MNKLARLKSRDLRYHVNERRILTDVPAVCREHILRALVEYRVEFLARDIESHAVGAGIEIHFTQVCVDVYVCQYAAAERVVLEVIENSVNLVEVALGIVVLDSELIAVCLADAAVLVSPSVPDVPLEVVDVVRFFLPYPEQLVRCALDKGLSERHRRELL